MFQPHPTQLLNELFSARPYQGVDPNCAEFLFIGLDANYSAEIESSIVFPSVVAYHQDGAAFWRANRVHHPFLLPSYSGDGQRYHRNFSRIGFTPEHADKVSFLELLHVPTVGRNELSPQDLSRAHLQRIDQAIRNGSAKHTFVSAGVVRLMKLSGEFPWLETSQKPAGLLPVLYSSPGRSVHLHLHFSNYGKFQAQMDAEAEAIFLLLKKERSP
jgi:hypothetical protein